MTQCDPVIVPVKLGDLLTAGTAICILQGAFYGDDVVASLIRFDVQHPDIGDIQGYGDLGAHCSVCLTWNLWAYCTTFRS
ncbi:MAG: hypothetical protein ACK2U2_00940, partial [Anaerolineae bacterium]